MFKLTGMDWSKEETFARIMRGAEPYGRAVSAQAHEDIAAAKRLMEVEEAGAEERELCLVRENMVVVRLAGRPPALRSRQDPRGHGARPLHPEPGPRGVDRGALQRAQPAAAGHH